MSNQKKLKGSQKLKLEDDFNSKSNKLEIIEIEQRLEEENPKIFKGIPPPQRREIIQTLVSIKHHSGPLPDAETLTQYDSVIPNGADRIMTMAEKQQDHRIDLEKLAVSSQLSQSRTGQIFGFIISLVIIACGTYLAMNGHEKTGMVLIGTTLVALAGIFVLGKFTKSKSTKSEDDN